MRGINEQLLKTSGVDVLPSTKKLKKHHCGGGGGGWRFNTGRFGSATVQIKFLTQWTQQITPKSKQNKTKVTKEPVLTRTSKIVLNF